MANHDSNTQERIQRIEDLVRRTEAMADPQAKAIALDLVQAVMEFHADALDRTMEIIAETSEDGMSLIGRIAADDLAGSMLLLHDLHPDDLHTRVHQALDKLNLALGARGGSVSLTSLDNAVARVQFEGGRARSNLTLKTQIEDALFAAAPDLQGVLLEGFDEPPPPPSFVPLSQLLAGRNA